MRCRGIMRGDPALDLADTRERSVPSGFKFRGNQPVLRIGGVILPECPISAIACGLKIAHQRVANLVTAIGRLRFGLDRRCDGAGFDDLQKRLFNGVIDAQSAKGDAARLAIIEQTPPAGIPRNVVLGSRVADCQLASAAPAADKTGKQGVSVFGGSVMPARGHVVADHLADRLCLLPADVTFMGIRDQRQPFVASLATALRTGACYLISRHHPTFTIGIGAAVNRVLDHPVDGRVIWPAPNHVTIVALGRQIQPMLDEPEQGLSSAAEFRHFVKHKGDGLLDTPIGILLELVADLHKADRGSDDEFTAPGLLVACRKRTLAQKIQLVLIETSLQSQQQPVIALARRIDRLLVDQNGIDDAAHLDELLPVPAVAGEARDLPRGDRTDLAEADLGDHPIEAGARDAAGRRAAEIVIDRFDARPSQRRQAIAHRILQGAALAIVQNLMSGRLPHIQDCLALQMVQHDLLRHHDGRSPVPACDRRRHARGSGGSSASSALDALPRATLATAASALS